MRTAPHDTKVTISTPGHEPVETTIGGMRKAADRLNADTALKEQGVKTKEKGIGIAAAQLKSVVERIERLEEEKAGIASDIKDVFAEAKGNGYDIKTLRKVISLRKQDAAERDEEQHLLTTYCKALGMGPLFDGLDGDE